MYSNQFLRELLFVLKISDSEIFTTSFLDWTGFQTPLASCGYVIQILTKCIVVGIAYSNYDNIYTSPRVPPPPFGTLLPKHVKCATLPTPFLFPSLDQLPTRTNDPEEFICSYRLVCLAGILLFAATSDASRKFSPVRVESRICDASVIDYAVDCGCYAYKDEYQADIKWQDLAQLCLDILGGDLLTGYAQCRRTAFMNGRNVIMWKLDDYFEKALDQCAYTAADYVARMFEMPVTQVPISAVGGKDELTSMVRIPARLVHENLVKFCLVAFYKKGLGRTEAYRRCCPGISRRRSKRVKRP